VALLRNISHFVEVPRPITIKKVAAFMCGNGVPLDAAIHCFNACCGKHQSLIKQVMSKWYSIWDLHPYTSWDCNHLKRRASNAEYYSVFFQKWLKINGRPVLPEITVTHFGVAGIAETQFRHMIRAKIQHVRTFSEK